MGQFDSVLEQLENPSMLTKLSEVQVEELRIRYPLIESKYIEFLKEVGYGDLGDIQIYNQPTSGDSIYNKEIDRLKHVLIFGDDMQGYCFGFDSLNQFRVVEIDPRGNIIFGGDLSFATLIDRYFGSPT